MTSLLVPLGLYVAVTVLVPLLTGNAGEAFGVHALTVLMIAPLVGGAVHLLSPRRRL